MSADGRLRAPMPPLPRSVRTELPATDRDRHPVVDAVTFALACNRRASYRSATAASISSRGTG